MRNRKPEDTICDIAWRMQICGSTGQVDSVESAVDAEVVIVLEYVALVILILVVLVLFYGIIVIHDIPYEIAVKRNHPHQDVLHVAGWVSLFTLHAIWPFLWIWAMMYREDRGWGLDTGDGGSASGELAERLSSIEARLAALEPGEPAASEGE